MSYSGNPIDVIKKLYLDKNWTEIVSFCKKMLEQDSNDLVGLQNLATALVNVGRFEEALLHCETVLQMNPQDEYALKNKVFALEKLRRYDDVIKYCGVLLKKNPSDTWALDGKGLALNELNRHQEALSYYDRSLQADPNNTTALLNKAITLSFLQKYEEAISFYDRAQKLDGALKEVAMAKSDLYKRLGREDEAFLAAQGVLVEDISRYIEEAREKKIRIFDLYCLKEYEDLENREREHQQKQNSKPN